MKDFNETIEYKDKEYKLVFNLNVMEKIQEEFGSIEKWGAMTDGSEGEPSAKAVSFGLTEMLNEGIDIENDEKGTNIPFLTKKQVGRIFSDLGQQKAIQALNNTVINSVKTETKNA